METRDGRKGESARASGWLIEEKSVDFVHNPSGELAGDRQVNCAHGDIPIPNRNAHVVKTSVRHDWKTPARLFHVLNREFGFTLDVAASAENAQCKRYFTIQENGLAQSWAGETCWMNPPYGPDLPRWMRKAYESARGAEVPSTQYRVPSTGESLLTRNSVLGTTGVDSQLGTRSSVLVGATVVCLVPARTHTKWFHAYCSQAEVRFLRGRLRFDNADHEAPFAQLVIIFRPGLAHPWVMKPWEWRPRSKQELLSFELGAQS